MSPPTWLTFDDICNELRIHPATWYRWIANPKMKTPEPVPGIGRLTRYSRASFNTFLETLGGTIGGTDPADDEKSQQNQKVA